MKIVLRRTKTSTVSFDQAMELLKSEIHAQVISQSDSNVLAEVTESFVPMLREKLRGWIVAPQGANIQVPDTRLKLRSGAG